MTTTNVTSLTGASDATVAELIGRSHRLGADPRNTNYAGGNTSAKGSAIDPVSGAPVELLWVKGSGGDLGTLTEAGLAVLRLDRVVLPSRPLGLVPGLAELQLDRVADGGARLDASVGDPPGRLNRSRREDPQDLPADSLVDAESPEGDTPVGAMIEGRSLAGIPRDVTPNAGVADMQAASAVPTPEKPRQQARTASDRASRHQALHL